VTADLPNVISTASLLLAVVTALMGFWYADVSNAIRETEPTLLNEKKTVRNRITPTFWAKALPLAIGSSTVALVFLWRAGRVVVEALRSLGTGANYSDMKAAFVATEILMITLAIVTVTLASKLGRKCLRLR
jgi:uncharacterized membrane protein (UPF0182 family)